MVLTYQEAVDAGARVLYAHDIVSPDRDWPEWDALVVGSTGQQWQAIGYRDTARTVLEAVGYADLLDALAEAQMEFADLLFARDAGLVERDDLRAEVERLHSWDGLMELLDEHWPADIWPMLEDDRKADAGHRVTSAMRWIDQLRTERDALAATLARVKVEGDRWANSKNYTVQFAGGLLREALRPEREVDDE